MNPATKRLLRAVPGLRAANVARVQLSIRLANQLNHPKHLDVLEEPCPHCGNSDDFEIEYRPYLFSSLKICACTACGLRLLRPMPTAKFYEQYYSAGYFRKVAREEGQADDAFSKDIYRIYRGRADRIASFIRAATSLDGVRVVFEVGAAHGCNLESFSDGMPEVQLYEDELDRRWERELESKSIRNWNSRPQGTEADLVLLSHVLEHFRNPSLELDKLVEILSEGGLVYVEVPNVPDGLSSSLPFKLAHTMYFSPKTLRMVMERSGFSCISLDAGDVISSLWRKGQ
jgi:hypothetical protein